MATDIVQPINPYNIFVDENRKLTRDAYDFLFNMFKRVGGSLSGLNAGTLEGATWESPGTIGSVVPNTGVFTTLTSTGTTSLGTSSAGVVLKGTTTNNNAATGDYGEYLDSVVLTAVASNTPTNITTLSLTAGDWEVSATTSFRGVAGVTSWTYIGAGINTVSATMPTDPQTAQMVLPATLAATGVHSTMCISPIRFSLTTTTTVYLIGLHVFTGAGSPSIQGTLRARRMR